MRGGCDAWRGDGEERAFSGRWKKEKKGTLLLLLRSLCAQRGKRIAEEGPLPPPFLPSEKEDVIPRKNYTSKRSGSGTVTRRAQVRNFTRFCTAA